MGIIVKGSRVVGNTVATVAGGIYLEEDSTLLVANTTVDDNTVTGSGRGGEKATESTHVVSYLPEYIFRGIHTQSKCWDTGMI